MLVPLTDHGNPYTRMMLSLIDDQKARASRARGPVTAGRRSPGGIRRGALVALAAAAAIVGVGAAAGVRPDAGPALGVPGEFRLSPGNQAPVGYVGR